MKKTKRSIFTVMGLSAVLLLGACGSEGASNEANAEDKEYDLKMSVTVSESSTWFEAATKLKEDLAEETDGRINLEIFANEQLSGGDSGKAVEGLSKGTIDLTFNSTIIYSILDDRIILYPHHSLNHKVSYSFLVLVGHKNNSTL